MSNSIDDVQTVKLDKSGKPITKTKTADGATERTKRVRDPHSHVKTVPLPPTAVVADATPTAERPAAKDGFSLKKFSVSALQSALARIARIDGLTITEGVAAAGTHQEAQTYTVGEASRKKLVIRYVKKSRTLQLQGDDKLPLFDKLAAILESEQVADEAKKAAVKAEQAKTAPKQQPPKPKQQPPKTEQAKQQPPKPQPKKTVTPKTATPKTTPASIVIEPPRPNAKLAKMLEKATKTLRKLIPTAFEFMPDQCVNDLAIGCADIVSNNNKLTDYSALLLPPFRGLEKFIFYLQTAKNIKVKMIGQAYERNNQGKYLLKASYRKKINSVVYAEVMAALYTTYFDKRNYYSHSDYTDNEPRHISDRNEVQEIFLDLLSVIEYNSKKLKEISFQPDQPE